MRIVKDNPIVLFQSFLGALGSKKLEWRGSIICFKEVSKDNDKLRSSMLIDAVVKSYGESQGQLYMFSDDIFILLTHQTTIEQHQMMMKSVSGVFSQDEIDVDFYDFSIDYGPFEQTVEIFAEEFAEKHIQIEKAKAAIREKRAGQLDFSPFNKMTRPEEKELAKKLRAFRKKPTIMVVDDDSYILKLLSGLLRGFDLIQASSAQEAINAYVSIYPDILFLDIGLQKSNGLEILEQIHKHDNDSFVVMLTAKKDMRTVQDAISKGATGYIAKPFSRTKVLKYVEMKEKD